MPSLPFSQASRNLYALLAGSFALAVITSSFCNDLNTIV
jgi:hypothetical protein